MSADQYRRTTAAERANMRCPECNTVDGKDVWVVLDEHGFPEFVANVESYCHDHINEAIRYKNEKASKWVVRQFRQVYFDPSKRLAHQSKASDI